MIPLQFTDKIPQGDIFLQFADDLFLMEIKLDSIPMWKLFHIQYLGIIVTIPYDYMRSHTL